MREVILDIETTGLDYRHHKIIEIGAIEFVDKNPTGKRFHKYINPQIQISDSAYKIHGISNQDLKDKPTFFEIADELIEFLSNSFVVAHNAKFDVGFINNELKLNNKRATIGSDRVICTAKIAAKKFPRERINLNALCKRFKIDNKHRVLHGALLDAELLMQVYKYLTIHEQTKLVPTQHNQKAFALGQPTLQKKTSKVVVPTEEEYSQHHNMVTTISNSLWSRLDNVYKS